jgi:hypothetical protein
MRAEQYAQSKGILLRRERPLGYGTDGTVWRTSRPSAVKALEHERNYRNEVRCYQRFAAAGIDELDGFAVPVLVDCDDALLIVEMSLVRPPFLLDFGKVYLDSPPPYWQDPKVMAGMQEEGRGIFEGRWTRVLSLLAVLRRYGIYYVDPKPGNIRFGDEENA